MYVHCHTVHNSKDLDQPKCPSMIDCRKKMWYIYTMEYYAAIKRMIHVLCRDMDESVNHYSQQTNTRTENQTLHILTHKWVLNNESTWTQGEEHHRLGPLGRWEGWGGIAGGGRIGEG